MTVYNKMNSTLVVIDMQDVFVYPSTDTYQKAIDGVAKQIRLARRRGDFIVMVEYDLKQKSVVGKKTSEEYPTNGKLIKLLNGYDKFCFVFKKANDGGNEVFQAMKEQNIPRKNIRVCGVYANYCVRETVETLSNHLLGSDITLIDEAILDHSADINGKKSAFNTLTARWNVKVSYDRKAIAA